MNTAEALCTRAFGGKDKLNRILKVTILFPYLLLNTAFSVRNNQCWELEMIANACFGDIRFPCKDQQRGGGDEVVQFFDQLRLIALLQSYSCLYCLNCNAEPGINFFRQFLKGEGRGGSSWWYGNRYPTSTVTGGVPPYVGFIGMCDPKGYHFQQCWSNRVSILSMMSGLTL